MEYIKDYLHIILHIDFYLISIINYFGAWTYAILFAVIFCETGIIFTPFLPGESLLFALGTISARGALNVHLLVFTLMAAAILGGMVNYLIGLFIGEKILPQNKESIIHKYVMRAHQFYEHHGGKTIIIARLIPIIRTYAPFVAGIAEMNFARYSLYNLIGGVAWIGIFLYISFYFGNITVIKENFAYVILGIIFISVLPALIEFIRAYCQHKKQMS